MTQDVRCTTLKRNPELFRIILRNAVEEIAGGMSGECATTPNKLQDQESDVFQKQEQIFHSQFKEAVHQLIDKMWNELEISHKISFINELESEFPADFIAWRPTAGEIPILAMRGHYLTETKERFLYKMSHREIEGEGLKKTLIAKATALKKSLKKISKAEEYLKDLQFEKIIGDDS